MSKYAVCFVDNGTVHYLVMFGYDGGSWRVEFAPGDLFRPVILYDRHSAYNLINLIESLQYYRDYSLYVEEVDLDA